MLCLPIKARPHAFDAEEWRREPHYQHCGSDDTERPGRPRFPRGEYQHEPYSDPKRGSCVESGRGCCVLPDSDHSVRNQEASHAEGHNNACDDQRQRLHQWYSAFVSAVACWLGPIKPYTSLLTLRVAD